MNIDKSLAREIWEYWRDHSVSMQEAFDKIIGFTSTSERDFAKVLMVRVMGNSWNQIIP